MAGSNEVLDTINKLIREEHGMPVKAESLLKDSGVDSFGFTMIIAELDSKYGCFDNEWFNNNVNAELTVRTILDRVEECK